ncbi:cupin domain-containing protein [Roseibacterium beibuensis]|uniref:cupin domain-containing protein n=1 Tax=[Roseibacterium] beibuensis TaxID=1193142 RepID=UPI00217EDCFA|nr:cupin domain-containing protein [Roseibacterium beibuensis]MCS6625431.1 cupin domain-containing protein [Roseibacterium beibuensis]
MASLDDLLHPITARRFRADYEGREPLHIPASEGAGARMLLDWGGFNAILSHTGSFTPINLRLVHNGNPVPAESYCTQVKTPAGLVQQPAPAKIEVLLSTGASLVVNEIQSMSPALSAVAEMLGRTFAATVGANAYCSFSGIQAFGTHFDLHDVFAIQTEGEKTWRLYEGRADAPVSYPPGTDAEVRRWFQETRGPLREEIRMRPGDLLYLPRGWYHDALADSQASLHVTFSVTPLNGRAIFDLLEQAAMQDPAFRAHLPPAHEDRGDALQAHLAQLGQRLSALAALTEFRDEVAMAQQRLVLRPADYSLPLRKPLTVYRPTGLTPPTPTGTTGIAMEWALAQPQFALEDLIAEFDFIDADALTGAVHDAERAKALKRL